MERKPFFYHKGRLACPIGINRRHDDGVRSSTQRTTNQWHPGLPQRDHDDSRQSASSTRSAIRRRDRRDRQRLQALLATKSSAAKGRTQCPADHDRRSGVRRDQHFWWRDPDSDNGSDRKGWIALHAIPLDRTLLSFTRRFDQRQKSPLDGLWRDLGDGYRLPGLRQRHYQGQSDGWQDLE